MEDAREPKFLVVGLGLVVEGGLALLAWGLGRWLGQPALATLWVDATGVGLGILATLPLLLLFSWTYHSQLAGLVRIRQFFDAVLKPLFARCTLLEIAVISISAGLGEEMLFRGLLQAAIARHLGLWVGLAVASLLFGLMHPITPAYVLLASLMGAYLGLIWCASGNLLVAVVAHALYDFLVLAFMLRPRPASGGRTEAPSSIPEQ
ncbi:MAG TPA: CPBP family intramembrane glutamic endopeptidase [Isosphaeraceae bacterium]|jgi:hypothetical protein|nr:CPBP family intramembrane glutamic endopeptidase [Isosphaeraceae bacterium]